jgi:hypothetical protein
MALRTRANDRKTRRTTSTFEGVPGVWEDP